MCSNSTVFKVGPLTKLHLLFDDFAWECLFSLYFWDACMPFGYYIKSSTTAGVPPLATPACTFLVASGLVLLL